MFSRCKGVEPQGGGVEGVGTGEGRLYLRHARHVGKVFLRGHGGDGGAQEGQQAETEG